MKKMFLSVLLVVLFICGTMMPNITAKADTYGDYSYDVLEDGTVVITGYLGNDTVITIPDTIDGKVVTSIESWAFDSCSSLVRVTIPSGVTRIGNSAFGGCSGLTSVTIPSSVIIIESSAFYGCDGLTSVTISSGVKGISDSAFEGCSNLTSITIPNSVTSIGMWAFKGCSKLTSVTIPSSVINIDGDIFADCPSRLIVYCKKGSVADKYAKDNYHSYDNFSSCKATLLTTTYTCNGKKQEPKAVVKDGSKTLVEGIDYEINYSKNVGVGEATVTITGEEEYAGKIIKTFTIKKSNYYSLKDNGGDWKNGIYKIGGVKMTDVFFFDGEYTYYLQADGTPMKNRLSYHPDGVHLIYFDDKGHELFDKFQYCKDVGYTCYFDTSGYLYKDVITFKDDKVYYLDGDGRMKQNEYFKFGNGVDLGYAQADGSLINTGFGYDPFGQEVFYHWNGMIARGLITDGTWYYNMDETDGHLIGKFTAN